MFPRVIRGSPPNGRYPQQVTTEYGEVPLEIPRDRDGSFTPVVVPPHQTTMVGIEDQVIALYARGTDAGHSGPAGRPVRRGDLAGPGVQHHGQAVAPYHGVAAAAVGRLLPRGVLGCPLEQEDKVREDGRLIHKAAYMVVGIDLEGYKDVLGMWIGAHESAKFWLTVLSELKSRGVQDVLVVAVDHLTGFSEAIATVFPKADVQKCVAHQIRNSLA